MWEISSRPVSNVINHSLSVRKNKFVRFMAAGSANTIFGLAIYINWETLNNPRKKRVD